MKTGVISTIAALFAVSPAFAHGGAHIHPHGFEGVALGLALIAVAGAVIFMGRRR